MREPDSMPHGYHEDLAYVHDAGFTHLAREAAALLLTELRAASIENGLVVDLGCGSGALAEIVSKAGFDVLGIDLSPAFIEMARRRVKRGEFRVASIHDLDLPPCVAVIAVGEVVNYLFDGAEAGGMAGSEANAAGTDDRLGALLGRIAAALAPGGALLFDAAGPGRGAGERRTFIEGSDWAVLVERTEEASPPLLTRRCVTYRRVPGDEAAPELYRRDEEIHRLHLHVPDEVLARLEAAGLRARRIPAYGASALPVGLSAFLGRKGTD